MLLISINYIRSDYLLCFLFNPQNQNQPPTIFKRIITLKISKKICVSNLLENSAAVSTVFIQHSCSRVSPPAIFKKIISRKISKKICVSDLLENSRAISTVYIQHSCNRVSDLSMQSTIFYKTCPACICRPVSQLTILASSELIYPIQF